MAAPHRRLNARALTLGLVALPVLAGLAGTLAPAFGWLPALGGHALTLQPWRELFAQPGFGRMLGSTLASGLLATLLSVMVTAGWLALLHQRRWARSLSAALAPLLATPHSALAIGFAFVIAPSGWLVRWVSPGLSGWDLPPDIATVGHPDGLALVAGLMLKEVPYLMLMTLGALNQVRAADHLRAAAALGHGGSAAALKVLWPQVYAQLRLPVYAVLAFSLTVVDVALVLGPGEPPTLAVWAVRRLQDPDVSHYFAAAAAAVLLLGVVAGAIGLWHAGERLLAWLGRRWIERGSRAPGPAGRLADAAGRLLPPLMLLAALSLIGLALWSFAAQWRFPAAWPQAWTLANWARHAAALRDPLQATLGIGIAATLLAALLVVACLEQEARSGGPAGTLAPLYLPLLVPQVAFLFGAQVLLVHLGLDGRWGAVVAAHLLFVLPYLYLSLADPWRAFDRRYERSALSLGATPARVFWRIKLPLLLPPLALALAVGFGVSVGLYLPTLFAGAGRVATLTTEAVTLAAGADRRTIGVWALLQAMLPLLAFALAIGLPRLRRLGSSGT